MLDNLSRSERNFLTAGAERLCERRADAEWIAAALRDPTTRVVPVWRARNLMVIDVEPRALLLSTAELSAPELEQAMLLGERDGVRYFAVDLSDRDEAELPAPRGGGFHDLREHGGVLEPREATLLAHARALHHWHRRHAYCGDCGAPTRSIESGHQRQCMRKACGARHFPRTDPAVIVLVLDGDDEDPGQRCLLGRPAAWPAGLYSTVAGFVEPGETVEQAVAREVREETGVRLDAVHYRSSQPWPFPSSIMLGFTAHAATTAIQRNDNELEDARWLTRADIAAEVHAGTLRLPRRISIAHRLVEDWYDAGRAGALRELLAR
ncbi:MAG: NAD(+) diphosphatase [Gammaproteobacteria bacterium]